MKLTHNLALRHRAGLGQQRRAVGQRRIRRASALIVLAVTASLVTATASAATPPHITFKPSPKPSKTASPANRHVFGQAAARSSDVAIDGWGDAAGYHVELGRETAGFAWREVALLRPAGLDVPSWTGYQCLSGDGRYAAVAILPTSVVNLATARDRGAFAYSVDLRTGKVVPIASGVGLKYYSPGCGTGDAAAFTLDLASNDVASEVITANLATGAVTATAKVSGQVTSAIPTNSGVVGVMGSKIVSLTSGKPRTLATAPGDVYDLHPAADGGLAFLTATPAARTSTAYHENAGHLSRIAVGPLTRMQLFGGRPGHTVLAGADAAASTPAATAGVRVISDTGLPVGASLSSQQGDALFGAPRAKTPGALVRAAATGDVLKAKNAAPSARVTVKTASYTPPGASAPSLRRPTVGHPKPLGGSYTWLDWNLGDPLHPTIFGCHPFGR